MNSFSLPEIRDTIEDMLSVFEQDENRFYVLIDIVHQLHAEVSQLIATESDE